MRCNHLLLVEPGAPFGAGALVGHAAAHRDERVLMAVGTAHLVGVVAGGPVDVLHDAISALTCEALAHGNLTLSDDADTHEVASCCLA